MQVPMVSMPRINSNMAALGLLPQLYSNTQQTTVVQPPPLMSVPHSLSSPTHTSTHSLPFTLPSPSSHTVVPSYSTPVAHTSAPVTPPSPKREIKCVVFIYSLLAHSLDSRY